MRGTQTESTPQNEMPSQTANKSKNSVVPQMKEMTNIADQSSLKEQSKISMDSEQIPREPASTSLLMQYMEANMSASEIKEMLLKH